MHPKSPPLALERLSLRLNSITETALCGVGLLMSGVVISQVFFRYGLNHSLFWSEELARYLLLWLTFLGGSVAYRRTAHPSINLLRGRLSAPLRRYSGIVVHLLCLLFFSILVWYGLEFSYFVRAQTTPALGLPKWIVFSIIPISGALMVLHGLSFLISDIAGQGDRR